MLAEYGDEAKALAGGQSLLPLLNMRFAQPSMLVDVNRIPGLDTIGSDGTHIRVGATVRQSEFGSSDVVRSDAPLAAATVPHIGHFVTRNRGTVCGSLAHADARGELPLALVALGGSVTVSSRRGGERVISADELFRTHFTTSLAADELLIESAWPVAARGWSYSFQEFAQRHGDYALAMVGVGVEQAQGRIVDACVAVAAVTDRPLRLDTIRSALVGEDATAEAARSAGAMAAAAVDPHDDLHASAAYRRHLTGVLVERACREALEIVA